MWCSELDAAFQLLIVPNNYYFSWPEVYASQRKPPPELNRNYAPASVYDIATLLLLDTMSQTGHLVPVCVCVCV